jgi:pimeloyl-ACP methyl ester carboxylesterase
VSTRPATRRTTRDPSPPAPPSGVLFFVHGANESSDGLVRHVDRIERQIAARGWDVRVVAPEWRRHSGLRLGNWRKTVPRAPLPSAPSLPNLAASVRRDALLKVVTSYFEPRREVLLDTLGAQLLADVIGYHQHRESIQAVLRQDLAAAARAAGDRPVLPVALSLGGIALVDLLARWPEAPVQACVTVGSQAPLLYAFDAIPSMPYDERDPPHLSVPWLNVYDTRDFLSFVAEPSFRRTDGLASVVDLRVRTGKDFPKSHSAYWEQPAVWDAIATAFTWRRTERMTVKEARDQGFEARKAPVRRSAGG